MENKPEVGKAYKHKKRQTTYTVLAVGRLQSEHWFEYTGAGTYEKVDMNEVVVYVSTEDTSTWVRPIEEFMDGRFEEL